jgi:hypothetical protein
MAAEGADETIQCRVRGRAKPCARRVSGALFARLPARLAERAWRLVGARPQRPRAPLAHALAPLQDCNSDFIHSVDDQAFFAGAR